MKNPSLLSLLFLLFMSSVMAYEYSIYMQTNKNLQVHVCNSTTLYGFQNTAAQLGQSTQPYPLLNMQMGDKIDHAPKKAIFSVFANVHPVSAAAGALVDSSRLQQVAVFVASSVQISSAMLTGGFFSTEAPVPLAETALGEEFQPHLTNGGPAGGTAVFLDLS